MNTRETITALTKAGFVLFKNGSKHDLYKKGSVVVLVVKGAKRPNPRVAVSLRAAIRRAERGHVGGPGRYV